MSADGGGAVVAATVIGRGPVAIVYSGRLAATGAEVAVKVFPDRFDRDTAGRLDRERRALATVASVPSILTVDAVSEYGGDRSSVLTQLCAGSLAGMLTRGALPVPEVLGIGGAVANALAAAHEAGVVHGGVTPHNVLFRRSGEPVLGDFGLALRERFSRDPMHALEYTAPETLRDDVRSAASDLYGLGAVLYAMLTGAPPFPRRTGQAPGERILRVLRDPVPPVQAVPGELSELVSLLLAKDPAGRPADATRVAAWFDHVRGGRSAVVPAALHPLVPPAAHPDTDFDSFAGRPDMAAPAGWPRYVPPGSQNFPPAPPVSTAPGNFPVPPNFPVAPPIAEPHHPAGPPTSAQSHNTPEAQSPASPESRNSPAATPSTSAEPHNASPAQPPGSVEPQNLPVAPLLPATRPHSAEPRNTPPAQQSIPPEPQNFPATPPTPAERHNAPVAQPPLSALSQNLPAEQPHRPATTPEPHNTPPAQPPIPPEPQHLPATPPTPAERHNAPVAQPPLSALSQNSPAEPPHRPTTPPEPHNTPPAQPPIPPDARNSPVPGPRTHPTTSPIAPNIPAAAAKPGRTLIYSAGGQAEEGRRASPRWWKVVAVVGACVVVAGVAVAVLLSGGDGAGQAPAPATTTAPSTTESRPARDVGLVVTSVADLGDHVELRWEADGDLDFSVVVAGENIDTMVLVANRAHEMRVPVDRDRKYCFQIRATDSRDIFTSEPVPVRGARCAL
ncbi:hypothetical protein JCM33774_12510 [Actinophytocola sp. KF-1]